MPKKLTLKECQKYAEKKGGKCLSEKYINCSTYMKWKCKEGHIWKAKYQDIKNSNSWCARCIGTQRLTLEECQTVAKERGGKCLSTKYINSVTKMKWECEKGHTWESIFSNIKRRGSWCPKCSIKIVANKLKGNIEECKEVAEEKGGKCLSTEYVNTKTKMSWECKEGHQWKTTFSSIKSGSWCPKCGIKIATDKLKGNIEECQKFAIKKEGECLSEKYINSHTKMKWKCKEGHQWKTIFSIIKRGSWCPKCTGTQRLTLEECQNVAKERSGKCLSTKYTNYSTKMKWECKEGHYWKTSFHSIKSGSWCPKCSGNIKLTLEKCKEVAEEKGGKCLSAEYINNKTKMSWKCEKGHTWDSKFDKIKSGTTWCPKCNLCPSCQLFRTCGKKCAYCKSKNKNKLYKKTKEYAIVKYLKEKLPDYEFIHNKSVGYERTKRDEN